MESPNGTTLTIAELDLATLQWRSLGDVQVSSSTVALGVTTLGAYAAVEADSGALAPPAATAGQVLGSSTAPIGNEVTAVTITFDPEMVLPTQTSEATVTYTLSSAVPSGLPLTLMVQEQLTLLDGTLKRSAPYQADVVLYHAPDGTERSRFTLQPSAEAQTTPIELGTEDVTALPYGDETVRGNVLGPQGGTVTNDDGDRLSVPGGSLTEPTAITLTRQTVGDLPLAAPSGGTVDGVILVDLAGQTLQLPGSLSLKMATPPTAGEVGLLLHVVNVNGTDYYRAVAELEPTATGWTTKAIDPADLPWPGMTAGGQYVFLHLTAPHAFVRGTARRVNGAPLVGGIVSSESVDWIQLTDVEGRYVLPVPVGTVTISITNAENQNTVSHDVTTSAADERSDVDTQVEIVAPTVISTTPTDGAVVPAGLEPSVTFSEPVDPATVADGITLVDSEGNVLNFKAIDVQGALVTITPEANMVPGASYQLRIGFGVKDFQGYGVPLPVTVSFSTQDVVVPSEIDVSKIFLIEPDANNDAHVIGDPGAVPQGRTIWVENLTSYATTNSTNATPNGSFNIPIEASLDDTLLFHVKVDGGNEIFFVLGPFMGEDRKSAWVGPAATEFTTAEDITVILEERTFDALTRVSVSARDLADPPPAHLPAPDELNQVFAFDLDFGEAEARKPLNVRVPASAGAQPNWYLTARAVDILGDRVWSLKDIMVLEGGYLTSERTAASPLSQAVTVDDDSIATKGAIPKAGETIDPRDYEVGMFTGGSYRIFLANDPIGWLILGFDAFAVVSSDLVSGMVVENLYSKDNLAGRRGLAVPILLGKEFNLRATDARSGYEIFNQDMQASLEDVVVLSASEWLDNAPPYPISGSPVRFYLMAMAPGKQSLDVGISAEVTDDKDGDGNLLPDQEITITFEAGSLKLESEGEAEVKLLALDSGLTTTHTIGPEIRTDEVTFSGAVKIGKAAVMTIGTTIRSDEWIEISWSEALAEELPGFELYLVESDDKKTKVKVESIGVGTYETVRLRPEAGWHSGEPYILRLTDQLVDAASVPNGWLSAIDPESCEASQGQTCTTEKFDIHFNVTKIDSFDVFNFQAVRDIERLGNLLFVAAGQQGLWVLDASDPKNVKNYLAKTEGSTATNEDLNFSFPLGDQVMGVAKDPHGRIIVIGGGVTTYGQLKIIDPTKIDPSTLQDGDPENDRFRAFVGSTLLSNPISGSAAIAELPTGTPTSLELQSWDLRDQWTVGEEVPEKILEKFNVEMKPKAGEKDVFTVKVEGHSAAPGHPVTLRNRSRRAWERQDANKEEGKEGHFKFDSEARKGEMLELVRHVDLIAYVTIKGVDSGEGGPAVESGEEDSFVVKGGGFVAVDVNHFYNELEDADDDGEPDFDRDNVQSEVLQYFDHLDRDKLPLDGTLCTDAVKIPFDASRAIVMPNRSVRNPGPAMLITLVGSYGLVFWEPSNANQPVKLELVDGICGTGTGRMNDMDMIQLYPVMVTHNDGNPPSEQTRDYVVMTNTAGQIIVIDVSDLRKPFLSAIITLPEGKIAAGVTINRDTRQLFISGGDDGVHVVDFTGPFSAEEITPAEAEKVDEDNDGEDDRLLETIRIVEENEDPVKILLPVELWSDLGLGWIGGLQDTSTPGENGMSGLSYGGPRFRIVENGKAGERDGHNQIVTHVAPFGTPEDDHDSDYYSKGVIRIEASLPSYIADSSGEIKLDLVSLGAGGLEVHGAGDPDTIENLPVTSLKDEEGLVLKRMADNPWEDGYGRFLSEPVVVLADLRASYHYKMSQSEIERSSESEDDRLCTRCDLIEEEVYTPEAGGEVPADDVLPEILSGHQLGVRLPATLRDKLEAIYDSSMLQSMEVTVNSVPWDVSPALQQSPTLNQTFDSRGVKPGVLLHSGEIVMDQVDLSLTGRAFNISLQRTYRSQTLGDGPFGPGWDHNYNIRLRELPNGDVEFFSRGRREVFVRKSGDKYEAPAGRFTSLERSSAGWMIVDPQANIMIFDRYGRFVRITDPVKKDAKSGNKVDLHYDPRSRLATVSNEDRYIVFSYDDKDHVTSIADHTGRTWKYEYDNEDRLTDFVAPAITLGVAKFPERRTTYTYDQSPASGSKLAKRLYGRDNLNSITDARGVKWINTIDYGDVNNDGVADEVEKQDIDTLPVRYSYLPWRTTVVDRKGKSWDYTYNEHFRMTLVEDPIQRGTMFEYDEQGSLLERVRDGIVSLAVDLIVDEALPRSLGNVEFYYHKANGSELNGSSAELTTQVSHHARFNLPLQVKYPGGENVLHGYNDDGLLDYQRHTSADGSENYTITFDDYNDFGQLLQMTNPNGHVMTNEYYKKGSKAGFLRKVVVDPGGLALTTEFELDDRGNVEAVIDPRGVRHEFDYNEADWLIERRMAVSGSAEAQPVNYREVFVYDEIGNIVEQRRNYGDAGEMTSTTTEIGNLGETIRVRQETMPGQWTTVFHDYDKNLNRTLTILPDGTNVDFEYNDVNQLIFNRTTALNGVVEVGYTYTPDDQVDTTTDPNGESYQTVYDAFSRPMKIIGPLGVQTITYDDSHNPRRVRYFDIGGNIASQSETVYDGFGRPWQSKTWLWDTLGGAYAGSSPPSGAVIAVSETTYDDNSNVKTTKDPNGNQATFEYDSAERLHKTSDELGNMTTFWRDEGGNVMLGVESESGPTGSATVTTFSVFDGLGRMTERTTGDVETNTYVYDKRGNLTKSVDGGGRFVSYTYDALDRVIVKERSGGVKTGYDYDQNGRLQAISDAVDNRTSMDYDELDRMTRRTLPDGKTEAYFYDANGNATTIELPNGIVLTQAFDTANRLKTISVQGAPVGPSSVSYSYDSLGLLTQEVAGNVTTSFGYDSAGRLLRESVKKGADDDLVEYTYDAANNLQNMTYPSGLVVDYQHDKLNRVGSIEWNRGGDLSPITKAVYEYRGEGLIAKRTVGLDIVGTVAYDAARRPINVLYNNSTETVFQESLTWAAGSMMTQSIRGDLGGRGFDLAYDSSYRLMNSSRVAVDDSGTSQVAGCGVLPSAFSFSYDQMDNLLTRTSTQVCEPSTIDLPLDGSGRNRPGSVSGEPLTWDANGNLEMKGGVKFFYDYRDRLTEVRSGMTVVASYAYDALNRRIEKNVGGVVTRTVWSGQQPIEDYVGELLKSRRTYGLGIDEIVSMGTDLSGDGSLDNEYVPFYDHTGNLVSLTDIFGKIVERYEYSPFGKRWIFVDSTAPAVEQVRVKDDALLVEFSEELLESALKQAVTDRTLKLDNLTKGEQVDIKVTRPVLTGRQARRRLVISGVDPPEEETSTWPEAGDLVQLEIPVSALEDAFDNVANEGYTKSFTWPAIGEIVEDLAAPRLDRVCLTGDGRVEIEFTEEVSTVSADVEMEIDGVAVVWISDPDRYVLRSQDSLDQGNYHLTIGTGPLDLSGKGLGGGYSKTFTVTPVTEAVVYSAPFHGLVGVSTAGNEFGFHGLRHDDETNFVYVRNRYYDPQLGRFISTDPYGYVDSPSLYQFALNNTAMFSDSTGLCVGLNNESCYEVADRLDAGIDWFAERLYSPWYIGLPVDGDWARFLSPSVTWDTTVGIGADLTKMVITDMLRAGESLGASLGSGDSLGWVALAALEDGLRVASVAAVGRGLHLAGKAIFGESRLISAELSMGSRFGSNVYWDDFYREVGRESENIDEWLRFLKLFDDLEVKLGKDLRSSFTASRKRFPRGSKHLIELNSSDVKRFEVLEEFLHYQVEARGWKRPEIHALKLKLRKKRSGINVAEPAYSAEEIIVKTFIRDNFELNKPTRTLLGRQIGQLKRFGNVFDLGY